MIVNPYPDKRLMDGDSVRRAWIEPVYTEDLMVLPEALQRGAEIYATARPFRYKITMRGGDVVAGVIPAGMRTDGTSTPRALHWYADNDSGRHLGAAILHDFLFVAWQRLEPATIDLQALRFRFANRVFYHAMRAHGVRWLKARLMWRAVHLWGWDWFLEEDGTLFLTDDELAAAWGGRA
ncbi:MAG: DUF1353 domain-containing protein [Pseudomonadota bacterium]